MKGARNLAQVVVIVTIQERTIYLELFGKMGRLSVPDVGQKSEQVHDIDNLVIEVDVKFREKGCQEL